MENYIDGIVQRLEAVVQEETALLKKNAAVDLQEFNMRKSQGLYDLSRAMHRIAGQSLAPTLAERLRPLRSALEANEAALSAHLQAAREISAVISQSIREAESDGTYAPPFKRFGGSA